MTSAPRLSLPLFLAGIFLLSAREASGAVDCSVPDPRVSLSPGNVFSITSVGFTNSEIATAAGYWSSCPGYGTEIPEILLGASGGIPVTVQKIAGRSTSTGGGCGVTNREIVNGHIESAVITVWTQQKDGASCAPLTDVIAHELGHVLGLDNAPFDSACNGRIMGTRVLDTRTVEADDCAVADDQWETSAEAQSNPDPYCDVYCWTSCTNGICPARPPDYDPCPIVLDLENDGIHLTGLDDPVWFDIDADRTPDLLSWTDRGEGFLALDRNGNGLVDHGGELFGNYTRLSDGTQALNGYLALAELDGWLLGGNGDGQIDAADPAFPHLVVWSDRNHDGVSQSEEIATLEESGVTVIDLRYQRANRRDRYGNELRFLGSASRIGRNGVEHPVLTWDIFFLVVP